MGDFLPAIYREVLPLAVLGLKFDEKAADCRHCSMAKKGLYREDLKCCTFYPFLANYLIGEAIQSLKPHSVGLNRINELIERRQFAIPLGLVAPAAYQVKFSFRLSMDFGRREDLICPFYHQQDCSIWRHRGSECAGFICQSSYGDEGKRFWSTLSDWLFRIEMSLSQNVLIELGYSDEELEENIVLVKRHSFGKTDEEKWSLSKGEWQALWAHWKGREKEFFISTFQLVKEKGAAWLSDVHLDPIQVHHSMIHGPYEPHDGQ